MKCGIDLKLHRATSISDSNIQDMDLILCATLNHKNFIISMFPNLKDKTFTIKEYAEFDIDNGLDISDPWGYDLNTYRQCASLLDICIDKIIKRFEKAD